MEIDGLIEPHMVVNVGSGVAGILERVNVDRGDFVKKGQVLAKLESEVEKATMELARARATIETSVKLEKAELAFSERSEERMKQLYNEQGIPFSEMDEAETKRILAELGLGEALENKRLAKLDLQRAIQVLKRRTILSPIAGVVVERFLSPGEFVEDQPILKLAQIDPLNVEVIVPVSLLGSIKVGMRAEVRPEDPPGGVYTAPVKIVDSVIDAASGTFGVRLVLPNPDNRLPAGLKCKVVFLDDKRRQSPVAKVPSPSKKEKPWYMLRPIRAKRMYVRKDPSFDGEVLGKLEQGIRFQIMKEAPGNNSMTSWYRIAAESGIQGWLTGIYKGVVRYEAVSGP
jgi:RND family efflux transporter MFP subunit